MFVIIGYIIVLGSVFGGFVLAGGHLASLFQPVELLMIGGSRWVRSWWRMQVHHSRPP